MTVSSLLVISRFSTGYGPPVTEPTQLEAALAGGLVEPTSVIVPVDS